MSKLRLHPLLLPAILLMIFGCAQHRSLEQRVFQSLDDFDALVDEHVLDTDRADLVHGLIDQFREVARGFHDDRADTAERFTRMNRNYNAEPGDFEAELLSLQRRRVQDYGRITVLALEARTAVTREEWDAIHGDLSEPRDH